MTDTATPATTDAPSTPEPFDPAIMQMVAYHVDCTVWSFVDNEATMKELEEAKKANPNAVHHWKDHRCYRQNPGEIAAAKAIIKNLNPQDATEAMLASQLTAVHLASIECLNRASWVTDNIENRLAYLNTASKLSRTFTELTDTLDRHRGKGTSKQEITVQHVHIHNGAQAVIGDVNRPAQGG